MSQAAPVTPPKPKRRRYWLWSLLLLFVVLAVWFFYPRHYRIRDLVAYLDKTEPGWRYDDLRLKVAAPPEEQNVVPFLKSLEAELPTGLSGMSLLNPMQVARPVDAGNDTHALYLRNNVELADENLEMLRSTIKLRSQLHKLLNYPSAYFLLPTWDDAMFRNVNNRPKLDEWWKLLTLHWEEGLRSSDTNDFENRTRLLWHHLLSHQLQHQNPYQIDHQIIYSVTGMERAIANYRFSDAFLQELEQRLAAVNFDQLWLKHLEMNRAVQFQQVDCFLDRWQEMLEVSFVKNAPWYERIYFSIVRDNYIEGGTLFLEYVQARLQQRREKVGSSETATAIHTKLRHSASSTSNPEWINMLRKIKNPGMDQSFSRIQLLDNLQARIQSREAQVKLLRVALAIERSRLASGKLPASWSDVVPRYLPAIPVDPEDPTRQLQLIPIKQGVKLQARTLQFHLLERK